MRILDALLANDLAPGLQYLVVNADGVLFEYDGGWADIARRQPVDANTTFMAYSMSKTLTAVAVLQLIEAGKLGLDDALERFIEPMPYGRAVTVGQVLTHTAGIPNPIPLRWVHVAAAHADFDDGAALDAVLRDHPKRSARPGQRYLYSNIGYWLLGRLIERVSGESFPDYMRAHVFVPLGIPAGAMGYAVPEPSHHAQGYLERYSMIGLLRRLLVADELLGEASGRWAHIRDHHVNGAAFGGIVGTARGFGRFLQDQLRPTSSVLGARGRELLRTQQHRADGALIPMTLGWHIEQAAGMRVLFKEGGGAGFHAMMRLYPDAAIGSVLLANATQLNVARVMNEVDAEFIANPARA